ncbi:MAG: hypothetical protein BWY21_00552 [Parcubacteria group bacterium ADurb.Bin216]|nr:MAG: hypothetical protein BWY21_00552 [Parcubacteria group bacterium ADurb.Bin216]
MSNITVNLEYADTGLWCIVGKTGWLSSGDTASCNIGDQIAYRYVEGYKQPDVENITPSMLNTTITRAYVRYAWSPSWGAPISGCIYRGQVLLGGKVIGMEEEFPSPSRLIRWSEIGAFRFLGQTANAKKNEAGFMYMSDTADETIMRVLPLSDAVAIYSNRAIKTLTAVSQPAPTYGVKDMESLGIMNPLAVAGGEKQHVFINTEGILCTIQHGQYGDGYVINRIGYQHIFGPMQAGFDISTGAGIISIVYNDTDEEYYISNGKRSFVFSSNGLSEIGEAFTSYVSLTGTYVKDDLIKLPGYDKISCITSLFDKNYLYMITDTIDFNMSAIKTITQVELNGDLVDASLVEIMVMWRTNRRGHFRSTPWRRCSPSGIATVIVSGVDLRICARISPVDSILISNMVVEWQLSDRTSVRGSYASETSSDASE